MKRRPQPQAPRRPPAQRAAARNERVLRGIEAQQRLDAHGTHAATDVPDEKPGEAPAYLSDPHD